MSPSFPGIATVSGLCSLCHCCMPGPSLLYCRSFMTVFFIPCKNSTAGHPSMGGSQILLGRPLPWVHFYSCRRHPVARCWSPYRSTSALIVSTVASSLRGFQIFLMGLQIYGVHFVQPFFKDYHRSMHFFQAGHLLWVGLRLFYTCLSCSLAGRLFSPGTHFDFHPFLMGI
jgi:hypothetical protein